MWPKDAGAQTIVPSDWSAKPAGLQAGAKFRLLFITTTKTTATSHNELLYDGYVQQDADRNAALKPHKNQFKAIASFATLNANAHTGMVGSGTGISIWWVGGKKVADSYTDFWDGTWDNEALADLRNERGQAFTLGTGDRPWTGTTRGGTGAHEHYMGNPGSSVVIGDPGREVSQGSGPIDGRATNLKTDQRRLYGISPVFQVGTFATDTNPGNISRINVPHDWALKPSAINSGGAFRLLFVTRTTTKAEQLAISHYDGIVTRDAGESSSLIRAHQSHYRAIVSVRTQDAIDHVGMTGTGIPVYWVNGDKAADNYGDFWDGNWDSYELRNQRGQSASVSRVWTGSTDGGRKHRTYHAGTSSSYVNYGDPSKSQPIRYLSARKNNRYPLYGISPIFVVSAVPQVVVPPTLTIGESGSSPPGAAESDGTRTVTVTASKVSSGNITVSYAVAGTATAGGGADFTALSGTVILPGGEKTKDISISINEDTLDEADETIELTLQGSTSYKTGTPSIATVVIKDNDPTVVSLARVGTGAVTEGGTVEFTVTLGRALVAGEIIDVPLSIGGTGVTTAEWTLTATGTGVVLSGATTATPNVRLTGAGAQVATLTLTAVADGTAETGGETFTVALGPDGAGANGFDRPALGTNVGGGADPHASANTFDVVVNDPVAAATPEVTISGGSAVTEGAGATYTVSASPAPASALTVNLAVADAPNADFVTSTHQGTGKTVTVPTSGSATYTVATVGDTIDEPNGPVTVTVAPGSGYTVGSPGGSAPVTVNDNDATTVTLTTPDTTATEGNNTDFALLRLELNRALRAGERLVIPLQFAGGVRNTNFTLSQVGSPTGVGLSGSTVTFHGSAGGSATGVNIYLFARADSDTDDETVTVSIPASSSGNAPRLTATGLGGGATGSRVGNGRITLVEPPTLSLVPTQSPQSWLTVPEGDELATGRWTRVTLSSAPPAGFSYQVCIDDSASTATRDPDGTRGSGSDFKFNDNADGHLSGGCTTVAVTTQQSGRVGGAGVTIYGDTTHEPDETIRLTLRLLDNPQGVQLGTSTLTYTIRNDDAAPVPVITIAGGDAITEGGDASFSLIATPAPTGRLQVNVAVTDSGDFATWETPIGLGVTVRQRASTRVVVPTRDDETAEADGVLTVTVLGGRGYTIGSPRSASVTVNDDDGPPPATPVVTIVRTSGATLTEGTAVTFTVSASPAPAAALGVRLTVADAPHGNFVASGNEGTRTVTVPPAGSTTLTLATETDSTDESDGPVTVAVAPSTASPVTYTVGAPASATVTMHDDDPTAVELSTPDATATEGSATDTARLTVRLTGRRLRAGERLVVPLGFSGATLGTDFTLALSGTPTGITLSGATVTFTGPSTGVTASTAEIVLTALDDADTGDDVVTVSIPASSSAGTPRLTATGLGGGATGSRSGNGRITVDDDDTAVVPVLTITGGAAVTEGTGATFTVRASPAPASALVVNRNIADAPEADFVAGTHEGDDATWVFPASRTSATFTVATVADTTAEPSGPVTATLRPRAGTPETYTVGAPSSATVTVNDDDGGTPPAVTPVAAFAQTAGSAPESAGTRTVRVTFAPATAAALTLGYTVGGTATPGTDYTTLPGTVAVPLGATSVDIAVAIADDSAVEGAETVILTLAPGTGYTVGSPSAHTLTVADDDVVPSVVGIARSSGATLAEGGSATFTVSASPAPVSALTVRLAVADAPEADFVAAGVEAAPTVTIAAGTASATYTLPTAPDTTDEPSGVVTVTVAAGAGYTPHATTASATVTVRDDDATVATLASPPGDLSETGGTKTVTVTLGRALRAPESLTMPLALGGAAVRGPDYTVSAAPATGVTWAGLGGTSPTATFTGGARTATLAFTAVDDGAAEGAEAVTVARGTPSANAHLHGGATGAGAVDFSIVERPTIGFSSATYTVDEGATLTVEMRLSTPWPHDIGTALKVVPGTAGTGDYDYTLNLSNGIATYPFSFWKTQTVRVHIPTVQDALREGDETFTLRFAGTAGTERVYGRDAHGRWRLLRLERVPFGLREATVTIRDDETPAVGVVVSREALVLDEGGAAGSYTVALRSAPAPGETVTVTAAVDDAAVARVHTGTDAPGASAALVFTDADWSQARTVTVTPRDDADTDDERTRIAHAVSGPGAWDGVTAPAVAVTVADDDAVALPQVTVAVAEGAAAAVFEDAQARFTVSAHPAPSAGLTVVLNVADAPHADFVASGDEGTRTVTIAPGAASADVTVATVENSTDEPSGPVTVTVAPSTASPATYAVGSASSASVAVLDDDATAVTLAVTDPTATEGDAADTAAIVLTLNRGLRAGELLRVPLQLAGGAVGTDFTLALSGSPTGVSLSGTTVTFTGAATPSAASATVRLAALPDPDAIDGTVTVSIPASSTGTPRLYAGGLGGGATGAGTGTIVLADASAPLTVELISFPITTPPGQAGLPEGATVSFNLELSRIPAADEVVLVPLVLGGDATRGADYTLSCAAYAGVTCSNFDSGDPSMTFDGGTLDTYPTGLLYGSVLRLHLVEDNTQESAETVTLSLGDNTHSQGIVDAPDAVVVSFVRNDFVVRENNGPIEPVMTVTPPAGRDIPLFFTVGGTATEGEGGDYYFGEPPVLPPGASRPPFAVRIVDNDVDEADVPAKTVILTLDTTRLPSWVTVGSIATATLTIYDADPTVVSLARTGPGALAEGEKTELTVTLGRALLAGEVVGVPLEVSGAGVTTADWTLALKPGAANTGVTLSHETTATPRVSLSGAGARTAVLELTAVEDGVDDAETLTVALGPDGTGTNGFDRPELGTTVDDGAGPHPSANRFDVLVDVVAGVSVKPGPAVTEGARATFTVVVGAPRARRLQVGLEVGQSGEYVDRHYQGILGRRFVHIRAGATSATFTVPTANDETNEAHGAVTARVLPGARYVPAAPPNDRASVTVNDDDGGLTGPALSVNDVTAREGADHNAEFTVSLSPAPTERVTVSYYTRESTPVSARSGEDYAANRGTLRFRAGETSKTVYVFIYEDFHDEPPETFEVSLAHARGGAWIADGVGVGTIVNDDPLPAAWLARFGRTVAEQALEGIAERRAAARTPGLRGTLAGQALASDAPGDETAALTGLARRLDDASAVVPGTSAFDGAGSPAPADSARGVDGRPERSGPGGFDPDFGDAQAPPNTVTMREALLGSRFTLTGAQDASGGTAAFWGRAAQGRFDGREGPLALDGAVTTAMLGADYARDRWLVGLALTQSEGEGAWTDTEPGVAVCPEGMDARTSTLCEGAVRSGDGTIESSLTAAIPYASLQASERVGLWGALGVGAGRVTLAPESGRSLAADTDWRMAAAGVRGALLAPGAGAGASGPALALTSDALWARSASERTRDLAASHSDVTRLRLGLEGSWRFALDAGTGPATGSPGAGGASLVPKLELGARHDGGDAETGFGLELGGGLAWDDPGLGLALDLSGRTLLAHEDDALKDRGFSAALGFDPDPGTERGPSASLRQELGGQATGGLDALFTPATLDERSGSEAASRWTAQAAWGFPAFGGRYTASPHVGLGFATGARDYTLGWRWTPAPGAPDLSFGLEATRRESDADAPEHTVGFEVRATW